jgi:DNA-binding NarL/FixJ family response regulator
MGASLGAGGIPPCIPLPIAPAAVESKVSAAIDEGNTRQDQLIIEVTPGEWRVLTAFLYDGASNPTLALRLGIDIMTVKSHLSRIMQRANVDNRAALAIAIARGHVRPVVRKRRHRPPHARRAEMEAVSDAHR